MRSSLSIHPPTPPPSHQSSSYSTPSSLFSTPLPTYPSPYFSSSASYPPPTTRPSQTTSSQRLTLTVISPSPYQDLLGLKALPQLYERIKRLGWIHQNMVMFLMQRAIGQYCPDLQEPHLSILCDALIQSCLKLQIHPKNASISFILRDDIRSEKDFVHALLYFIQSADSNLKPETIVKAPSTHSNSNEYEENSPEMVKFLAFIRKMGMDLLFPLLVQDKIMIAIYQGIQETKSCPHRDLIERVMSLKTSGLIGPHENVTKTKIRGVLALLKHANILYTESIEGTPVQLCMAESIDSFRTLRQYHDQFLIVQITKCVSKFDLVNWRGILWHDAEDWVQSRSDWVQTFVKKLSHFHAENSQPGFGHEDANNSARQRWSHHTTQRSIQSTTTSRDLPRSNESNFAPNLAEDYIRRSIHGKKYQEVSAPKKSQSIYRGSYEDDDWNPNDFKPSRSNRLHETQNNNSGRNRRQVSLEQNPPVLRHQGSIYSGGVPQSQSYGSLSADPYEIELTGFPNNSTNRQSYDTGYTKKIRNSLNDKIGAKIPIAEGLGEKWGSAGSTSGEMLSWSSDSTWDFPPPPGFSPTPSDDNGSHFSLFQSNSTDWLDFKNTH